MKAPSRLEYHTYILRFWAEEDQVAAQRAWRFLLQSPRSGEEKCFTSLEALTTYLAEEKLVGRLETGRLKE